MTARETATYTCPQCRRRIVVLADEYGDYGCACGWEPYALDADIRDYVEYCVDRETMPDAFSFSSLLYPRYKDVPGRVIDELITKELTA